MEHNGTEVARRIRCLLTLNGAVASTVLAVAAATLLILVAGLLVKGRLETGVDYSLSVAAQALRGTAFEPLMVAVSYPGYWPLFPEIVAVVTLIVWLWRSREEALLVAGTLALATLVAWLMSELVGRTRPDEGVLWVYNTLESYSYPSRHVVTYVVFFGLLCYLALARWKNALLRWPTVIIAVAMIVLVGPSRVFLGVHWPSDALAGYALGGTFLAGGIHLFNVWCRGQSTGRRR